MPRPGDIRTVCNAFLPVNTAPVYDIASRDPGTSRYGNGIRFAYDLAVKHSGLYSYCLHGHIRAVAIYLNRPGIFIGVSGGFRAVRCVVYSGPACGACDSYILVGIICAASRIHDRCGGFGSGILLIGIFIKRIV
jgi:hypothetical protein